MPYCPNCGAKIEEDASFCPKCGLKIEEEDSPNISKSEREEDPINRREDVDRDENDRKTEKSLEEPIGLLIGGFVLITIGIFFNLIVTGSLGGIILWLLLFLVIGVLAVVALVIVIFTSIFIDIGRNRNSSEMWRDGMELASRVFNYDRCDYPQD